MERKQFLEAIWEQLTGEHGYAHTLTSYNEWIGKQMYYTGLAIGEPLYGGCQMYADRLKGEGRVVKIKTNKNMNVMRIVNFLKDHNIDGVVRKYKATGYSFRGCWVYAIYTNGDYPWNLAK